MQVFLNEGDNFAPLSENKNTFLESPLLRSQKMEALGILACGIAHDFNNILSAMIGYAELSLAQIQSDSGIKQNLWEILQAGRRAKELINQILRFRREDEQEKKIIKIVPILMEVCKLLRASAPANIEVKLHIENYDYLIKANPIHIYQILMNLCTNAMQAIGDKHGLVEIKLSSFYFDGSKNEQFEELKPGPYLCLTVRDTGVGMTPEIISKIFNPYFTTKKDEQGNGLGLSIVRCLVKSYKGGISVFSEPGKGSIFQIFLPGIDHENYEDEDT